MPRDENEVHLGGKVLNEGVYKLIDVLVEDQVIIVQDEEAKLGQNGRVIDQTRGQDIPRWQSYAA